VPASINPVENAIAELVAERIGDRSVLQFGIGAVPDAIATKLHGTRDLSIHTALLGDRVLELIQSGAVTNRYKPIDPGVTIAGLLVGTRRLYDFAHENPSLQMKSASYTHNPTVLAMLPKFVAINSAVEVDLTGQVNAEVVDGVHVGAVGGAVDFMRGAAAVHDGCAIVALPSTARGGTVSRIVARPTAGVTTAARSDVDLVVTEFGVAELKGRSISERALRLAAIAHEAFRDELLSAASTLA
jgi:acyl-CoA hydrolase